YAAECVTIFLLRNGRGTQHEMKGRPRSMKLSIAFCWILAFTLSAFGQSVPADWQVSLERTPCFGMCPIYKVSVDADGTVTARDSHDEIFKSYLIPTLIDRLYKLSDPKTFLELDPDYLPSQECDGPFETDHPSEVISIRANGRFREFIRNKGCKPRPGTLLLRLIALGDEIDRLTDDIFLKLP